MTLCIIPRPISALGTLGFRLILVSRADTEYTMERACIILYTFSMYMPVIMLYFQL